MLTQEEIAARRRRMLPNVLPRARGRTSGGDQSRMNRTEAAYGEYLLARMVDGDLVWFEFSPMKFRLADRSWYTPDFIVMRPGGELEAHEVKGHMEDDAAVKLRVFARLYPMFRLFLVRRAKHTWKITERSKP